MRKIITVFRGAQITSFLAGLRACGFSLINPNARFLAFACPFVFLGCVLCETCLDYRFSRFGRNFLLFDFCFGGCHQCGVQFVLFGSFGIGIPRRQSLKGSLNEGWYSTIPSACRHYFEICGVSSGHLEVVVELLSIDFWRVRPVELQGGGRILIVILDVLTSEDSE